MTTLQKQARACAAAAALFVMAIPVAQADAIYNNLASSQDGADPIFSYGPLADSFTTLSGGYLSSVQALLKSDSASVVGDIVVSLHADNGNVPGAEMLVLGSLSSAAVSTTAFAAYSFTPAAPLLLAANTTYWVEIQAATPNALEWSWSGDLQAPGVAGQFNYSGALGVSANSSFAPYQMLVEVAPVPEPGAAVLAALGLALLTTRLLRRP